MGEQDRLALVPIPINDSGPSSVLTALIEISVEGS
jgi:hypothetical protein